jgi:4-hydroxy 2-oxovalerate aldolase
LRDGGYINDWQFGEHIITDIVSNLGDAGIDIIECGFLRPVKHEEGSSVFSSVSQLESAIAPKKESSIYVAMIELNKFQSELLDEDYTGRSIDGIRLTFRKKEWEQAKKVGQEIMKKGYKLFIQPVGTCTYSDEELLPLIKDVNKLKPFAFYLVDTLGMMYRDDMRRFYYLIDNHLDKNICIGFHSHNNLQLSFANAQELIRLNQKRKIIVDTSVYGMGRGVGNLATELFIDYINNNIEQRYSLIPILNIADKYLMPIYAKKRWGYDLPYFLSATVKCHPNYATYLIHRQTLSMEKIMYLLSLIPIGSRDEYDEKLIENLYYELQECSIDDTEAHDKLMDLVDGKVVLIIGPGSSIESQHYAVAAVADRNDVYVISTNFYSGKYAENAVFISNERRYKNLAGKDIPNDTTMLATSNLQLESSMNTLVFDYSSLLGEGASADNAGAMLIRLLKKAGAAFIYLAGFDGFDVDTSLNYFTENYKNEIDFETAKKKNGEITKQLKSALSGIEYEVITKTKYEI